MLATPSTLLYSLVEVSCIIFVQANSNTDVDPERQRRAMEDPDIQAIMRDPIMQKVLEDLSTNPRTSQVLK